MSCTDSQIEDVANDISESVANNYDFTTAVGCFKKYSNWNEDTQCYEKFFDTKDHAKERIEKYVNKKMNVPGNWKIGKKDHIKIEEGKGDVFYKITVYMSPTEDYKGSNYTAYFKKQVK